MDKRVSQTACSLAGLSGYSEYALKAFDTDAGGYLLNSLRKEALVHRKGSIGSKEVQRKYKTQYEFAEEIRALLNWQSVNRKRKTYGHGAFERAEIRRKLLCRKMDL